MFKWYRRWWTRARMPWCEWGATTEGDWYCHTHKQSQKREHSSGPPMRCAVAEDLLAVVQ